MDRNPLEPEEDEHVRVVRLVREQYEAILDVGHATNESLRGKKKKFLSEHLASANAVSTFAVNARLITPDESLKIMKEFFDSHPELEELFSKDG